MKNTLFSSSSFADTKYVEPRLSKKSLEEMTSLQTFLNELKYLDFVDQQLYPAFFAVFLIFQNAAIHKYME